MTSPIAGRHWQRAREDAGLKQADAARSLDISPVTLSRYETGARPLPAEIVERMRTLYGAPERAYPSARPADHGVREPVPSPYAGALAYWLGRLEEAGSILEEAAVRHQRIRDELRAHVVARADIDATVDPVASVAATPDDLRAIVEGAVRHELDARTMRQTGTGP